MKIKMEAYNMAEENESKAEENNEATAETETKEHWKVH